MDYCAHLEDTISEQKKYVQSNNVTEPEKNKVQEDTSNLEMVTKKVKEFEEIINRAEKEYGITNPCFLLANTLGWTVRSEEKDLLDNTSGVIYMLA